MNPNMADLAACVVCGKTLKPDRVHVDTCSEPCFKRQLREQRAREMRREDALHRQAKREYDAP